MAKKKNNSIIAVFGAIALFFVGVLGGCYLALQSVDSYEIPKTEIVQTATVGTPDVEVIKSKELSVHFLELGNKYTGDCTFIKSGETEILIDAGSRADSVKPIYDYVYPLIDGKLDYVIVTHAHRDHYAGFATGKNVDSLFDLLNVDTVITFSQTNQKSDSTLYNNFRRELEETKEKNGTKVYNALECYNEQNGAKRTYAIGENVEMEILYQKYYEEKSATENDYSVCMQINRTVNSEVISYLFTGDLEKDGEKSLVEKNSASLKKVALYKAAHHGSKTSSSNELLEVIQPDIVCVCACAGSTEYTTKNANTFPTQQFVDRIAKYTEEVYVTTLCIDYGKGKFTSMNGNIVISSTKGSSLIEKTFSASDLPLFETEWFKQNRTLNG